MQVLTRYAGNKFLKLTAVIEGMMCKSQYLSLHKYYLSKGLILRPSFTNLI